MRVRELRIAGIVTAGVLGLLLAACPDKKPKYPACAGDKDCKEGEHCINKKCVQCGDDSHCAAGETCQDGACVKRAGFCESDADCPNRQVCRDNQCVPCQSDGDCPDGRCSQGQCIKPGQCAVDEDCEDDEDCVNGVCTRTGPGFGNTPDGLDCQLAVVYFEFDSAIIGESSRADLEATADCIKKTDQELYIVGHTDPRGTDEYNIALSDGRARAVADYLARLGIDPARFHIIPKGEAEAQGVDEASWVQDRKVQLEWK